METPNFIDRHVGSRLRQLRLERGLDPQVLARTLAVTTARLERLEAGKERLSAEMLRKLSRILRAQPSEFFAGLAQGGKESAKSPAVAVSAAEQEQRLLADFARIRDAQSRDIILALVAAYAEFGDLGEK